MAHIWGKSDMKIRYKNDKCFKIIPENGTVYATGSKDGIMDRERSTFTVEELCVLPYYILEDSYDDNNKISAKAVCDRLDTFDENVGIDIAGAKIDMKNHLRMARLCDRALRDMETVMRKLEMICNKHYRKAKAIQKDLEEYYGGGKRR